MIVSPRFLSVAAFAALVAAAPAYAQSAPESAGGVAPVSLTAAVAPADSTASTAPAAAPRGPTLSSASVAARLATTESNASLPVLQNRQSNRNALAMMIVGGAALLVGAVIGDDAGTFVMLGGAAVGLYGLYLFLT